MKIRDLKILNVLIKKEGIIPIAMLFFITGVLIGGGIASKALNSNNQSLFVLSFFGILIWSFFIPSLKKYIKIADK